MRTGGVRTSISTALLERVLAVDNATRAGLGCIVLYLRAPGFLSTRTTQSSVSVPSATPVRSLKREGQPTPTSSNAMRCNRLRRGSAVARLLHGIKRSRGKPRIHSSPLGSRIQPNPIQSSAGCTITPRAFGLARHDTSPPVCCCCCCCYCCCTGCVLCAFPRSSAAHGTKGRSSSSSSSSKTDMSIDTSMSITTSTRQSHSIH